MDEMKEYAGLVRKETALTEAESDRVLALAESLGRDAKSDRESCRAVHRARIVIARGENAEQDHAGATAALRAAEDAHHAAKARVRAVTSGAEIRSRGVHSLMGTLPRVVDLYDDVEEPDSTFGKQLTKVRGAVAEERFCAEAESKAATRLR